MNTSRLAPRFLFLALSAGVLGSVALSVSMPLDAPTVRTEDPQALAPLRGRVVDVLDAAPVPWFLIEITSGALVERALTDKDGNFVTTKPFPKDEVMYLPVDHPDLKRSTYYGTEEAARLILAPKARRVAPAGGVTTFEIEVGPTYRFVFTPHPEKLPPGSFVRLRTVPIQTSSNVWSVVAPLREETGLWTRFDSYPKYLANAAPEWVISVESADGLWSGEGPIDTLRGVRAEPVKLAMSARARLAGRLVDGAGKTAQRAWLTLEHVGVDGTLLGRTDLQSDWEGKYECRALEPGTYVLKGDPLRHKAFVSAPRTLAALEVAKLDIALESLPPVGAVSGTLTSTSGTYSASQVAAAVELHRTADPRPLERKNPEWLDVDGKKVARFSFDALPAGEYEVFLVAPPDEAWDTRLARVRVPSTDTTFVRTDK